MIRVGIVEDDTRDTEILYSFIEKFGEENGKRIRIQTYSDGYDIAERYSADYDIIFLDIEMNLMDGLEAAEKIRTMDQRVVLIFTTSNPQYAIRGYRVHALDYLLKPLNYENVTYVLRKAVAIVEKDTSVVWISISTRTGVNKINASDILYIESRNHTLIFHTDTGTWETTVYSLTEMEDKLSGIGFFRASRWQLINLNKVRGIRNGTVVIGSDSFPVAHAKLGPLMEALARLIN